MWILRKSELLAVFRVSNYKFSFIYNDYDINFKLKPRRDIEYVIDPYQMVANNGRFYLLANYDKYDNISHYRLGIMTCVRLLDEKIKQELYNLLLRIVIEVLI